MAHHRHRESYPPPLFVAELDTAPIHGTVASPQGGLAFEMPGESAPVRAEEKKPARVADVGENVQANPWPFYLDQEVKLGADASAEGKDKKEEAEQANPWPYHGPASGDDAPSATVYPQVQQSEKSTTLSGGVAAMNLDGKPAQNEASPQLGKTHDDSKMGEQTLSAAYPAPLRVSRPNSISMTSPPTIKPYSPPPEREDIPAGGLGTSLTGVPPKSPIQGPQSPGVPYRPYRPPESSPKQTTISQSPSAAAPPFYTPFNPDSHSNSRPGSPLKQGSFDVVQNTENGTTNAQSPSIRPFSPPQVSPAPSTASLAQNIAPAPTQTPVQSPPPVNMAAQAPLVQPSPTPPVMTPVSPMPPYRYTPSPHIPSPASPYIIQQPTYAPSPSPQSPYARPQVQHANTDPSQPVYTPSIYPGPGVGTRPDSQPPQYPSYLPPPPSPYPSQPTYASPQSPPLPSGKPPPPLPPRRPNAQYGGFGGGPANATSFPPPPKTHYSPMPMPPRPQGGGGMSSTSLFSSSSAKKWLDKTSQVLESKLESVLQGPQGPAHRPAYTGPPPQAYPAGPPGGMPPGYGYAPGPWGQGSGQPPPGWR